MAISKPVYEDDESIDEQIRSSAAERSASKTAPDVSASDDTSDETSAPVGRGNPSVSVPAPSSKRTPIVTKEQLAASGLSLRDYLNKQQGLTRRGESSTPARTSTRMPSRPGQESPTYSNEGRGKSAAYETPYDRMNRENRASGKDFDSLVKGVKDRITGAGDSGQDRLIRDTRPRGSMNPKTLLPTRMAKGGSVSSASKRADGIAQRGKTKGKMC